MPKQKRTRDETKAKASQSGSDEDLSEGEYIVEKIVDKRKKGGKMQYLLKWQGYPDSDNTWEYVENVFCTDLIAEFEKELEEKKKARKAQTEEQHQDENNKPKPEKGKKGRKKLNTGKQSQDTPPQEEKAGFEFGDSVENIIGARMINGELNLYCSWKGKTTCTFVPAKVCNIRIPQQVIAFYESRLRFEAPDDEEDMETAQVNGRADEQTKSDTPNNTNSKTNHAHQTNSPGSTPKQSPKLLDKMQD
mmetsp:Transcript_17514/g.24305  ORF Transcript_17514/g.24305 Transcript_17514/m.24305 type:complete len:248 (-) Transcript_17514:34-777(-)